MKTTLINTILKHLKAEWWKYGLETLVVIIGILIAFALNNWNEGNKTKKLERSTLIEISNALEADLAQLNGYISIKHRQDSNVSVVLNYLRSEEPYREDLNTTWQSGFLYLNYTFNTSPFDLLKSRGFDIVLNDKIRRDIQKHYDISIPQLLEINERNYGLMDGFRNTYISHFYKGPEGYEFIPSNVDELRSEEIINGLSMLGFWHHFTENQLKDFRSQTEQLNAEIVDYLSTN